MQTFKSFEELRSFLENWVNAAGQEPPYDFIGILSLFRATMQSMNKDDFEAFDYIFQEDFFSSDDIKKLKCIIALHEQRQ